MSVRAGLFWHLPRNFVWLPWHACGKCQKKVHDGGEPEPEPEPTETEEGNPDSNFMNNKEKKECGKTRYKIRAQNVDSGDERDNLTLMQILEWPGPWGRRGR